MLGWYSGGLGTYFGLFDGHGGVQCADYVQRNLHKCIHGVLTNKVTPTTPPAGGNVRNAILEGFAEVDARYLNVARRQSNNAGSTALVRLYLSRCFSQSIQASDITSITLLRAQEPRCSSSSFHDEFSDSTLCALSSVSPACAIFVILE